MSLYYCHPPFFLSCCFHFSMFFNILFCIFITLSYVYWSVLMYMYSWCQNCGIAVREDSKHHDSVGKKFTLSDDPSLFSLLWEDFLERNGQGSHQSDNVTAVEISNDSVNQQSGRGQQRMEEEFQKLRPGCEPNSYLTRTMKCRSCQKCGPDEVLLSPCATYRDAICMQMPVKQPFGEF